MIEHPAINENSPPAEAERWVIVVRAEASESEVPTPIRVRRWLKAGLRGYRLRCMEVSDRTPAEQLERARAEILELRRQLDQAEARAAQRPRKRRKAATAG